jgi:nucleoside-diphosphate-sugar epimerase
MRNLLIVGCGDVVRRALPALARRWRIIALVRCHDATLEAFGVRQILGDLDQPHTLRRLAGIADAVIHSAPPPATGSWDSRTRRLVAVLKRGKSKPRRLVYIGTTGVYGDCGGDRVPESRPRRATSPRATRRVDAEQQLRAWGASGQCRVSILRAPGIYAANRLPLERLRKGLPLLHAAEDSHTNHIHAEDLARACITALHRGSANRSYNLCDDSTLPMGDWFDLLADNFDLPRAPRVSRAEAEATLPAMQWSFMRESRRLLNTRMKRELKFRLDYATVADGIKEAKDRSCSG